MNSETKTSRDVKRDRNRGWKAPANHVNSTTRSNFCAKSPEPPYNSYDRKVFQRDIEPHAPCSKKPTHRTRRDCHNNTGLILDDQKTHCDWTRTTRTRSSRGIYKSHRARAQKQWRAHRRARRVKEDDRAWVGRADQGRQGRVWAKRRDGVAVRTQPVCCERCRIHRRAC